MLHTRSVWIFDADPYPRVPTIDDVVLLDDGTLDTVIAVECRQCGGRHVVRYDADTAYGYRNGNGDFDIVAFFNDVIEPDFVSDPFCERA